MPGVADDSFSVNQGGSVNGSLLANDGHSKGGTITIEINGFCYNFRSNGHSNGHCPSTRHIQIG